MVTDRGSIYTPCTTHTIIHASCAASVKNWFAPINNIIVAVIVPSFSFLSFLSSSLSLSLSLFLCFFVSLFLCFFVSFSSFFDDDLIGNGHSFSLPLKSRLHRCFNILCISEPEMAWPSEAFEREEFPDHWLKLSPGISGPGVSIPMRNHWMSNCRFQDMNLTGEMAYYHISATKWDLPSYIRLSHEKMYHMCRFRWAKFHFLSLSLFFITITTA